MRTKWKNSRLFLSLIIFTTLPSANVFAQQYVTICTTSPLDCNFSAQQLLNASTSLTPNDDLVISKTIRAFFANTSGTLRDRIHILQNKLQSGATVFHTADKLYITFNPDRIRNSVPLKSDQAAAVSFTLLHVLSHIAQNDYIVDINTPYSRWSAELNADKRAGRILTQLYPQKANTAYFSNLLPNLISNSAPLKSYPPIKAGVLSAVSGFCEAVIPNTHERAITEATQALLPSERKKNLKEAEAALANDEPNEALPVGNFMEYGSGYVSIWFKYSYLGEYTYIAHKNKGFISKSGKWVSYDKKDDDDDGDNDDRDDFDLGNSEDPMNPLINKSDYYYQVNESEGKYNIGYVKNLYPVEIQHFLNNRGKNQTIFMDFTGDNIFCSVWENGGYFEAKIDLDDDSEQETIAGTYYDNNGYSRPMRLDKYFREVK